MKLEDAHTVAMMASQREQLALFRDRGKLSGSIDLGGYKCETLDPVMVALIRPVIQDELNRRIAVIDHDLQALGVEIEGVGELTTA